MLFAKFTFAVLLSVVTHGMSSPMPLPAELQPILASKNHLGGTQLYADRNSTSESSKNESNAAIVSRAPLAYISVLTVTAGTLLATLA